MLVFFKDIIKTSYIFFDDNMLFYDIIEISYVLRYQ
jgi:hypothetical protein